MTMTCLKPVPTRPSDLRTARMALFTTSFVTRAYTSSERLTVPPATAYVAAIWEAAGAIARLRFRQKVHRSFGAGVRHRSTHHTLRAVGRRFDSRQIRPYSSL